MNNNNVLILAISIISAALIGAFVAIALLYPGDKGVVLAALALLTGAIFTQLANFKVSADAKTAAVESTASSKENALSIAVASQQQSHALQAVDQKVDGHLSGLTKTIELLTEKVADLEKDKAVKRVETAQIIATAVAAVAAVAPLSTADLAIPPIDEPRVGDKS